MADEQFEFKPIGSSNQYKKDHKNDPRPDNPKEGRVLKRFSNFFFVLSCISLFFIVATFILPFLIALVGVFSALLWVCFILIGTVCTLGMMWLSDGVKDFNQWWMDANNSMFDAGNNVQAWGSKIIPPVAIVGTILIVITWIFIIVGFNVDQARHRHYKGKLIALSIISGLFVIGAIITLIITYGQ